MYSYSGRCLPAPPHHPSQMLCLVASCCVVACLEHAVVGAKWCMAACVSESMRHWWWYKHDSAHDFLAAVSSGLATWWWVWWGVAWESFASKIVTVGRERQSGLWLRNAMQNLSSNCTRRDWETWQSSRISRVTSYQDDHVVYILQYWTGAFILSSALISLWRTSATSRNK